MKSNEYNIALYIAFVFPLHSRYITGAQAPASSRREARPQKPFGVVKKVRVGAIYTGLCKGLQ